MTSNFTHGDRVGYHNGPATRLKRSDLKRLGPEIQDRSYLLYWRRLEIWKTINKVIIMEVYTMGTRERETATQRDNF